MPPSLKLLLSLVSFLGLPATPRAHPADALETMQTDVLVIGGGSAGTYGAVRLLDAGKSVVIVEPSGKLGGHAETWVSDTGGVVNVGVQILYVSVHKTKHKKRGGDLCSRLHQDIPVVTEYFDRLGVPLTTAPAYATSGFGAVNADFALGVAAPPANLSLQAIAPALQRYGEYLAANFSTVYPGFFLPDPVPEDMLLSYGDFMTKYGLGPLVNLINLFIQPAEAWREPALFPLKLLNADPLRGITSGFRVTNDVNDLYRAAAAILGDSVLLNASVVSLQRGAGVEAIVRTSPTGPPKRVLASKLLMTAPPVAANLAGWDLSEDEALFGKFKTQQYHAGVIRNYGLPQDVPLQNVGFTTPFNIPALPALFTVVPNRFGDGTAVAYYTARERVDVPTAQADTLATLERLAANGVIGQGLTEILEWYDHANVRMYVEAEDVRAGFYRDLYALQGQRNTFWSGAAWVTQASSPIWDYTKSVVDEGILAAL